jgi:hypothetical protein
MPTTGTSRQVNAKRSLLFLASRMLNELKHSFIFFIKEAASSSKKLPFEQRACRVGRPNLTQVKFSSGFAEISFLVPLHEECL